MRTTVLNWKKMLSVWLSYAIHKMLIFTKIIIVCQSNLQHLAMSNITFIILSKLDFGIQASWGYKIMQSQNTEIKEY